MRPGPQVELVLGDIGISTSLEGGGVVSGHIQPRGVVEAVHPVLAIGLVTLNGTDVVGFAVVVPGDDFDNIDRTAIADDCLPTRIIQMVVGHVNPLKTMVRLE